MNNKILIVALAAMIVAGCASAPSSKSEMAAAAPAEAAAPVQKSVADGTDTAAASEVLARTETSKDSKDRVICRQITPTGSHRKKTVCRTVGAIKEDRDSAQDAVRGVTGVSAPGGN